MEKRNCAAIAREVLAAAGGVASVVNGGGASESKSDENGRENSITNK